MHKNNDVTLLRQHQWCLKGGFSLTLKHEQDDNIKKVVTKLKTNVILEVFKEKMMLLRVSADIPEI